MMRWARIWAYHFRNAFAGIFSNRLINAISIGTISISLSLFGAFALLFVNTNIWILEWGKSLSMSVYLEDGVNNEERKRIESILEDFPGAQVKAFIGKERAMMDLKATLGAQAGLLDGLSRNPLPASIEILFKDVRRSQLDPKRIKGELEKIKGVSEVQYSEQYQEKFEGVLYMLKVSGLIVGSLLCMAVLFIITNTIKLTIYSRRDEIEIYKLVGASDWFVRVPFLIEGAVQGLFGGVLSVSILFLLHSLFSTKTVHLFGLPLWEIVFLPHAYLLLIVTLGLLLGLAGSFIAIGRFFKF